MSEVEGPVAIYALCDPRTSEIRYIGKARKPDARLAGHLRETRRRSPLYSWIASLRAAGLTPTIRVMAVCAASEWMFEERRHIAWARALGPALLNLADGGDQPLCSKAVRAQNGRKVAAARQSTPERRELWALKRNIGENLRKGIMPEGAKAKLRAAAALAPELFGEYALI